MCAYLTRAPGWYNRIDETHRSVCVLCGSRVWPSPPVVGPLRGPPLCVGPVWVGSSPVVFPFPVASVPRLASRSVMSGSIALRRSVTRAPDSCCTLKPTEPKPLAWSTRRSNARLVSRNFRREGPLYNTSRSS